jgi:DNA-binding NtrC family response regulator
MPMALRPTDPILIVDDEESILLAIDTTLQMAGLNHTITCHDSRQVAGLLASKACDLMLLDLNMPYVDGRELLAEVSRAYPDLPIIVITGAIDVNTAVQCMKTGAFDYIVKPVEGERLLATVQRALTFRELKRENLALRQHILSDSLEKPEAFAGIITRNKTMLAIFQYVESIARTSQPVLIRGETGVGKELIARSIHTLSGRRGQFVPINVAGLDDNVFSDTLFGHVKGAFTGADKDRRGLVEQASGGTLFLDEIGDLSTASQVKLLRLLQEGEYLPLGQDEAKKADLRVIASTNADLWKRQQEGKFRNDLNYRLRTHRIYIPPLRERVEDIALLLDYFLQETGRQLQQKIPGAPDELVALLSSYSFPGNVRELQTLVFDAVSRHKSGPLSMEVFKTHIQRQQIRDQDYGQAPAGSAADERALPLRFGDRLPTIKEAGRLLVGEALKRSGGNQTAAARMLGITQQALSKRLKNMGQQQETDGSEAE